MDELRQQTKEERKQRAKAAFKVSENIAKEREELVHQLHHLKDVNKNMMDRKVIFFTYCSYLEYVVYINQHISVLEFIFDIFYVHVSRISKNSKTLLSTKEMRVSI